jgi:protein-S-isoprenylcysteine O-methyltransferase Ste14
MDARKSGEEFFLEFVPIYNTWYKILSIYFYHLIIFVLLLFLFWWVGSNFLVFIFPVQFFLACGANAPFIYMFKKSDKIRETYIKKYKEFPWLHFYYRYSYSSPFGCAALYSPLLLVNYDFLPSIINLPSHFITNSLFSIYISLPLGFLIIFFGISLIKPSQSFDGDMHNYLHIWLPDKNRIIMSGIYRYIRHPRFLSRLVLSIGFGVLANSLLSIGVALIHFIPYYTFMRVLDKELVRMFGNEIQKYVDGVPALLPRYGNWKKFIKYVFVGEKMNVKRC